MADENKKIEGEAPLQIEGEASGKVSKKKGLIIVGIVALVLVLIVALAFVVNGISKKSGDGGMPGGMHGKGGKPGMSRVSNQVYPVRTVKAAEGSITDFVSTSGEVETQTSVDVFPEIGGKIVQVFVSLGSHVNRGDVIAKIDASEAGTYFAPSPVVAPISGSILTTPTRTGSKVTVSNAITKIGDIYNLQVTAKIPERYVGELKNGLKADISLEAYPGVNFPASVTKISPVLDPSSRTKEVILNFDKRDSRINAGMFAKVKLYTTTYSGKIVVPQSAVVATNDANYVYVVKADSTVDKKTVTVGKTVENQTQILTGVEAGETVVTEGMLSLFQDAKVNDLSNPSAEQISITDAPEGDGKGPQAEASGKKKKASKADKSKKKDVSADKAADKKTEVKPEGEPEADIAAPDEAKAENTADKGTENKGEN